MTTQPNQKKTATFILAGSVSLILFTGCSALKQTIQLESRVMVKIPGKVPADKDRVKLDKNGDGWNFKHVVAGPSRKEEQEGQWYLAWNEKTGKDRVRFLPFLRAKDATDKLLPEVCVASKQAFGVYPMIVEPNMVYAFPAKEPGNSCPIRPLSKEAPKVHVRVPHAADWPTPPKSECMDVLEPIWYQGKGFSQIAQARKSVPGRGAGIKIGILDNGFDNGHVGIPGRVVSELEGDAYAGMSRSAGLESAVAPGCLRSGHGTGTIGILAGRNIELIGQDGRSIGTTELGALPNAEVVQVRIAPFVASLTTANLAYGLDYASRVKGCDVISMSHGGAPSQMWMDAVNAAYQRGTAIVAATGNNYNLPFTRLGVVAPSSPVYPAASRSVLSAAGVTASGRSFAQTDTASYFKSFGSIAKWKAPWEFLLQMKGNYGLDGSWRSFVSKSQDLEDPRKVSRTNKVPALRAAKVDVSQLQRLGALRTAPVSAYTPNSAWLVSSNDAKGRNDQVDLDGNGTSSAAPQVAAAVGLWMAKNRAAIERDGQWRSWKKTEAAYQAVILSAERRWENGRTTKKEDQYPDLFLGAGTLKAADALKHSYASIKNTKGKTMKFGEAPRDFFDGSRNFWTMLSVSREWVPYGRRADLITKSADWKNESMETALTRLYYNLNLLDSWGGGTLPLSPESTDREAPLNTINQDLYSKAEKRSKQYAQSKR